MMPVGIIGGDGTPVGIIQSGKALLELKAGEVVRALVRDVTNQEVVLLIRGHRVEAQTQVPLRPGERVNLQVVELKEGKMVLQLVPAAPGEGEEGGSRLTPEALLERYGLPRTPAHLLLAQGLLAHGRGEISRDGFLLLARLLGPQPTPGEVQVLVRLYAQGQDVQPSHGNALQALMRFFAGEAVGQAGGSPGPFEMTALAENLARALEGWLPPETLSRVLAGLSMTPGEGETAAKLAALAGRLGLDYEARLLGGGGERAAPQGEEQVRGEDHSLKEILLKAVQAETSGRVPGGEGMTAVKHLLQVLTGLQLLHLGQAAAGHQYLLGWLHWPERQESSPFFLSFFQDPQGGGGPGEPGRQVLIKTQTPRLGAILGELRFFGSFLSVQLSVETREAQKACNRYAPELAAMLEDLPWRVQVLPCRLVEKQEKDRWWQQFVEPSPLHRVDVLL